MVRAERPRATVSVPASGSGDLGSGIEIGVVPTSRAVQSPGAGRHHGDDNGLRGNKSCCEHRPGHHVVVGSQQTITGPGNTTVCAGETTSLVGLSPFQRSLQPLSFILGRRATIATPCEAMFKVLVHHHGAPANAPFYSNPLSRLLLQLLSQPLLLSFLLVTFAAIPIPSVAATTNEGIIQPPKDVNGLSIIDSPAPNS